MKSPKEVALDLYYQDEIVRKQLEELLQKPYEEISQEEREQGMFALRIADLT